LIKQDDALQVSDHVFVILDDGVRFVPNVGIVIGEHATLIVDTGVGTRTGEIILEEARKLSSNEQFFIASTHYHSEHELGAGAFPDSAQVIRSRTQQQDIEESGAAHRARFSGMSPALAELIEGSEFRAPDILFDDEYELDLGGVTVRMRMVGPAHTLGDTVFFVEGDGVLFSGDVVMNRFPGFRSVSFGLEAWRDSLAKLDDLDVQVIVPSHGPLGDAALMNVYDEYLATVLSRTAELKAQGLSAEEAATVLMGELGPEYPEWREEDRFMLGNAVRFAYDEVP
jgi:glyoxylase-like metal-dependent hydrolase (beta-lactamase superfamily II)